jgi:hypothetical protein
MPDGRIPKAQNVGVYVWDMHGDGAYNPPTFFNNVIRDNQVVWNKVDPVTGSVSNNPWWFPHCAAGACPNQALPSPFTLHPSAVKEANCPAAALADAASGGGPGHLSDESGSSTHLNDNDHPPDVLEQWRPASALGRIGSRTGHGAACSPSRARGLHRICRHLAPASIPQVGGDIHREVLRSRPAQSSHSIHSFFGSFLVAATYTHMR